MISQDAGYSQRVGDIRFTTPSLLAIVRLFGVKVGASNLLDLGLGKVGGQLVTKSVYGLQSGRPHRQINRRRHPVR